MTRHELYAIAAEKLIEGYNKAMKDLPNEKAQRAATELYAEILRRLEMLDRIGKENEE